MKLEKERQIICGFAGIGKSYYAKNVAGVVDLESTPFNKNWDLYTDVAIHMQKNGYIPLVSCHKEVREMLYKKGANYVVVIPQLEDKQKYLDRYKKRGNNEVFIQMLDNNWKRFVEEIIEKEENIIVLEEGFLALNK